MSLTSVSRRDQNARDTRIAIIRSAHGLFSHKGFAHTSIDLIASEAHLTKGAVYHHFKDKKAVFRACFELQAESVADALRCVPDSNEVWDQVESMCRAFLEFVRLERRNTIPLQEVITVLGWEKWREIDTRHTFGFIETLVSRLQAEGRIRQYPADWLCHMIYGLMVDAAMTVSRDPREQTVMSLTDLVMDMIRGLQIPR